MPVHKTKSGFQYSQHVLVPMGREMVCKRVEIDLVAKGTGAMHSARCLERFLTKASLIQPDPGKGE
ncbi:MAG: hypothetical protein ACI8T1_002542 [Verrucomicrobiales bacterium]|jgi:hypothetical protein